MFYSLEKFSEDSDVLGRILEKLAFSQNSSLLYKIASYPKTPPIVLEVLAIGRERQSVARNPNTPLNLLLQMVEDKNSYIYQCVVKSLCQKLVKSPNIPADILQKLAAIKDRKLGISIISHSNAPESVFLQIANQDDIHVRLTLAKNPKTPIQVLEQLLKAKERLVRVSALTNLQNNYSGFNIVDNILGQWETVQNAETESEKLVELAVSKWQIIREAVAIHPNTSTLTLEQLVQDKKSSVRCNVAKNPNTHANLLEKLAVDKDEEVTIIVTQNTNTSVSLIEQLARQGIRDSRVKQAAVKTLINLYPNSSVKYLEEFIKSFTPSFTRLLVFLNPLTPSSYLAKNFRSSSWLERYAIAQNTNTPLSTRQRLAIDGNRIVRAAAKTHLE